MTQGTTTQAYGESWYWDNRYAQETGPFDWYQKYPALSPLFDLYINRQKPILVIGCGNSSLSEDMVEDGYQDVVNTDISSVVIEAMKKKYQDRPQLKYIEMDVREMSSFQDGSFGAVIDKGTLDSILCGSNSQANASNMLKEVGRVLEDKGIYILITYGSPSYRLRLLRDTYNWTVKLHVIDKAITDGDSKPLTWALTEPVPLEEDGSSAESFLGKNPDIHYIYVCTKEDSLAQSAGSTTTTSTSEI